MWPEVLQRHSSPNRDPYSCPSPAPKIPWGQYEGTGKKPRAEFLGGTSFCLFLRFLFSLGGEKGEGSGMEMRGSGSAEREAGEETGGRAGGCTGKRWTGEHVWERKS